MIADVSVVVPCYNASATIERALRSVMSQTLLPRELIVVDDYSSDSSYELLRSLADSFRARIHIVIQKNAVNLGASASRNIGWDLATSKYIAFLDADDAWMPNKIERQYAWMSSHPECTLSGHRCFYPGDYLSDYDVSFMRISEQRILISNPFPTPSVMLRREISQRFDTTAHQLEDHLLWSEIALSGGVCFHSKQMLAQVYKSAYGEGGLSKSLVSMERGELRMYHKLYQKDMLPGSHTFLLMILSLLKFVRRVAIFTARFIYSTMTVRSSN